MRKTAIIFGAGASYNSIPVVSEMVEHFDIFIDKLEKQNFKGDKLEGSLNEFKNSIKFINENLEFAQTPDAVMNSIYSNSKTEFDTHLRCFWIYLLLIQFVDRSEIGLDSLSNNREHKFIDKRYYEFISDCYNSASDDYTLFSWNYDIQFQIAFNKFYNSTEFLYAFQRLNVYPNIKTSNSLPYLLHLNGISGLAENNHLEISEIEEHISSFKTNCSLEEGLRNSLWILSSPHRTKYQIKQFLKFSFTNSDEESKFLKKTIRAKMKGVNKLIFIGYSFPELNREIDQTIISSSDAYSAEIVVQNPIDLSERIKRKFDMLDRKLTVITDRNSMNSFQID